ncbi:MAG: hypothetical protein JWP31_1264, partial [Aeromicrobium sp.]|nr:hypothetical protein [Aeromicrobium sp.]
MSRSLLFRTARAALAAVVGVLLIVLILMPLLGILGDEQGILDRRSLGSSRTEVVDTAKKQVIDLTTVSSDNVDAK